MFILFIVSSPADPSSLGFGSSLPFCAEKRSSLLHESEGIFVALFGKQSFRRHESTMVIVVSRGKIAWQQYLQERVFMLDSGSMPPFVPGHE